MLKQVRNLLHCELFSLLPYSTTDSGPFKAKENSWEMCYMKCLFGLAGLIAKYILRELDTARALFLVFHFRLCLGNTLMNFQLGWYAHAIFVDGQYPAVSGDGRSQSWSESCSLNTVRVQGDEGEDRCEERGSRLRGVAVTNLL